MLKCSHAILTETALILCCALRCTSFKDWIHYGCTPYFWKVRAVRWIMRWDRYPISELRAPDARASECLLYAASDSHVQSSLPSSAHLCTVVHTASQYIERSSGNQGCSQPASASKMICSTGRISHCSKAEMLHPERGSLILLKAVSRLSIAEGFNPLITMTRCLG